MNYLSVENIAKAYGEKVLFHDISFGINKDQKIAFVAKNGTGKTSILNILSGDDETDSGTVIYRNDLKVSFLSQNPKFENNLTVEDSIFASDNPILKVISNYEKALLNLDDTDTYQAAFESMERHQAWDFETLYKQILFKLKLEKLSQKISTLSGGQKKRLALANALINKPDLLILDEPTAGVDIEIRRSMWEFLQKLNNDGITIILTTHYLEEAESLLEFALSQDRLTVDGLMTIAPLDRDPAVNHVLQHAGHSHFCGGLDALGLHLRRQYHHAALVLPDRR